MSKKHLIKRILSLLFIIFILFSLYSCGKSDKNEEKKLKIGVEGITGNFNPFYMTEKADKAIASQIHLSIQNKNASNKLENAAGSISYQYIGDNQVKYTVTIKENLYFSDGTNATIDDVIFWYYLLADATYDGPYKDFYLNDIVGLKEYYYDDENYQLHLSELNGDSKKIKKYLDYNYENGADVKEISGIKRVDNYTCTVLFNSHNINAISQLNAFVVSKAFYSKDYVKGNAKAVKEYSTSTLGCGPYYLKDYNEKQAELSANKFIDYTPEIKSVTFIDLVKAKKNPADAAASGYVDIVTMPANNENASKISKNNLKASYTNKNEYCSIFFNSATINIEARKILMAVCDPYSILEAEVGSNYSKVYRPISIRYEECPDVNDAFYKSTMKTSLLPSYITTPLNVYYSGTEDDFEYKILSEFVSKIKSYGVGVNLKITDDTGLMDAIKSGKADMWLAYTADGDTCDKYDYYNSNGIYNYTGINFANIDELTYQIRTATGFADKSELTKKLMDAVMGVAIELPLYQLEQITVYNTDVIDEDSLLSVSLYDDYTYILSTLK